MWRDHWAHLKDKRKADYSQPASLDQVGPAECVTGESNTSSQEGSQSLLGEEPCMHPASLYEEVKRLQITCSADDDDSDWVTVPVRRPQAHLLAGKQSEGSKESNSSVQQSEAYHNRGRGRGRGRRVNKQVNAVPAGNGLPCNSPL